MTPLPLGVNHKGSSQAISLLHCSKASDLIAVLDEESQRWRATSRTTLGSPQAIAGGSVRTIEGNPLAAFLADVDLESRRAPGHERCFHRRARDLTSVSLTVGFLLRTELGRAWAPTLAWEALVDESLEGTAWTNGHALVNIAVACGVEPGWTPQEIAVPSDGRATVVYEWGIGQEAPAVVLFNDGNAFIRGKSIDIGRRWRGGESLPSIAADLARQAGFRYPVVETTAEQW